jgi:hypothetical protein
MPKPRQFLELTGARKPATRRENFQRLGRIR